MTKTFFLKPLSLLAKLTTISTIHSTTISTLQSDSRSKMGNKHCFHPDCKDNHIDNHNKQFL